ncbi:helix-turn-helix domain-containing protein [Streptomyces rochei]|uniref:helix-turn-helix domain-containing protein n=1 Tax=Streptomyces rochei TaxID=1928 RepID=UPI00373F92AD
METDAWPEENWGVLGERIAEARRAMGMDQAELAERSANSPNTISNYERGRATKTRRIPAGLLRVARVLDWPPDAVREILSGVDPNEVLRQSPLFHLPPDQGQEEVASASPIPDLTSLGLDLELTESGWAAQDSFVRQMKRYRKLHDVPLEDLANRVAAAGVEMDAGDIARLEDGTRLLRMREAKAIAAALGTTVGWILGSAFDGEGPEELSKPPTAEELQVEAKAVERRIFEAGTQANQAALAHLQARQRAEDARLAAERAFLQLQQVTNVKTELERQYHYLLGRIDSMRAAVGEEPILQTQYLHEVNEGGEWQILTIGAQLADARKRVDMTLDDVHLLTRIRPEVIDAIERNDFDSWVADHENQGVYVRGYIRVLARAYGIDPAPLIEQYALELNGSSGVASRNAEDRPRRRVVRRKRPKNG